MCAPATLRVCALVPGHALSAVCGISAETRPQPLAIEINSRAGSRPIIVGLHVNACDCSYVACISEARGAACHMRVASIPYDSRYCTLITDRGTC